MSINSILRCGMILFAALLVGVAMVYPQNLVVRNSSTFGGTGTYTVRGDITTPGLTSDKSIGGTVNMARTTVGTQSIGSVGNGQTLTFGTLNVNTSSTVPTTLQEVAGVAVSSALSVANLATLDIQNKTLTISGTSTLNASGALDVTDGSSTVNFNSGGASQSVLGLAYAGTLNLSAASTKSFSTLGSAATMTHADGDLTVNQNWSVSGSGTFATIADITAAMSFGAAATTASINTISAISSGSLTNNATGIPLSIATLSDNAGTITNAAAGGISFTTATNGSGTIETSGGGNLTFAALGGNSGIIRTTAAGGLTFTGAAVNTGAITGGASTGAIAFGNTLSNSGAGGIITAGQSGASFAGIVTNSGSGQIIAGTGAFLASLDFDANVDNNAGTITLGSNGSATFQNNFVNSGTLALNSASNWTYDGASQNIAGGGSVTYGNLLTDGSGTKTALGDISVVGSFNNGGTGDLAITTDLDIYALTAGSMDNTNATLQFGGTTNGFAPGVTTAAAGTVVYNGDTGDLTNPAFQTIAAGSYFQLQFAGNSPKNMVTNTTVTTGSGVSLGASVALNVVQTSGTTTLTINGGGLTLAASSAMVNDGTVNVTGDLDNAGSITNNGSITVQ